jgi:hypothetical protein
MVESVEFKNRLFVSDGRRKNAIDADWTTRRTGNGFVWATPSSTSGT